jgi:acyl-CoA reductase-like NAD-dependent aldehyde dehydrogenase
MKIGPVDVKRLDECLDVLEQAFQSPMWKQLNEQDRTRLLFRLSDILETAEKKELKE